MIRKQAFVCAFVAVSAWPVVNAQSGNTGTGNTGQTGTSGQPGTQTPAGTQKQNPAGALPGTNVNQRLSLQRSDKLIGMQVQDDSGVRLGRVDDLILRSDGTIAYGVIGDAQGQGMEVPVPWQRLRLMNPIPDVSSGSIDTGTTVHDTHLMLSDVDAARWRTAPHFDRTTWPKDNDTTTFGKTDEFFGPPPSTGTGFEARPIDASARRSLGSSTFFRASKLQNQAVTDANGQPVGRFGQLVFDPAAGRLNYVSLSLDGSPDASGRTVAMPWETLRASRQDEQDRFQMTTQTDRLRNAPQYTNGDETWSQMSDPKWVGDLYSYYSVKPYWNSTSPNTRTPNDKGSTTNPNGNTNSPNGNKNPNGSNPKGGSGTPPPH